MKALAPALLAAVLTACTTSASAPIEGRILDYVRSNVDGSEAERVAFYQKSATEVEVHKRVARCTNAALVTATVDPAADEAVSLAGGRLSRDGTQEAFGWLHLTADRKIAFRVGSPEAEAMQSVSLPGSAPWRLYDFDFADFNALARIPVKGETRSWEMMLAWPDAEPAEMLRNLGTMTAQWEAVERRAHVEAHRYALSGAGFDGGQIWLDAADGTVVEVIAPVPNHPGYADYRLLLTARQQGPEAWKALLADHWTGCPPADPDE